MDKASKYQTSRQQIEAITAGENNLTANLANIVAVLKQNLGHYWVGFYVVDGETLVLGPFQGTPACVRIAFGKGVCGTAWQTEITQVVENVDDFPGHIACDALSKSEIVTPIFDKAGQVIMVLDIDHDQTHTFDQTDREHLESLSKFITSLL